MASPGELVRAIAAALGIPEAAVVVHDRNLVQANLRTKTGRGRSAAKVIARDAAHVLTAVLGSGLAKDSVLTVERYAATTPNMALSNDRLFADLELDDLAGLPTDHSFIDGLEAVIASTVNGSLAGLFVDRKKASTGAGFPHIEIAALTPKTLGTIRFSGMPNGRTASVSYARPLPGSEDDLPLSVRRKARMREPPDAGDLEQYRRVSAQTILRIASLLRKET